MIAVKCPRTDKKNMNKVNLISIIICPECGFKKEETMPENACLHFYKCHNCGMLLMPYPGDCCVFCSYGIAKCPPEQIKLNE